ncbi:MAG: cell division ATP-binding protein FtsE [Acidobacteria bacterium]|nr:MAG: cell division ATP-binding protein FtsE [Acidobacteriota bacterium]
MITFQGVTKMYEQGVVALRNVSFHLEKGGFAFLTGPSGAGKTTVLKLIYREERPSEGSVEVAGRDTCRLAVSQVQRLRRRMGIVFQDGRLIDSRDVFENVTFVLRAQGLALRARKERALNVLRQVGLSHRMRSLPRQLSGGEQQRVAIARAVAADPDLLLADEPTGNLDREMSVEIMEIFRRIHGRGTTILIATHDPFLLRKYRRRVLHLEDGCLTDKGVEKMAAGGDAP